MIFTRWYISEVIQTPVMIPVMNDNIIRNLGVTAKKSRAVIIKQISTATNEVPIMIFLSFILTGIKELRY
jgi:hypothetical protein